MLIPLLLFALPSWAQTSGVAAAGGAKPCALRPLSAQTDGERIRMAWWSPACGLATVRVYRRRQHVGTEELIHPVVVVGTRNDTTFVQCWDTLFTELGIYEYHAVPVDPAGTEGPSSPWLTATNLHAELRPWLSSIRATDVPGERAIRLRWTLHNPERVRAIVIHRANRFDGPYEHLADVPPTDTTYLDRVQRVKETYFYRIGALDVVGNSTMSMPVQGLSDAEPVVAAPLGVTAEAGVHGITVRWPRGGPDVAHYQVLRGAPGDEAPVLLADGIKAPEEGPVAWTDSAATDNRVWSYRVRAVSIGGPVSDPSEAAIVQAADDRVPTAPTGVAARWMDDGTVAVSWVDPWAEDLGLSQAVVERADGESEPFKALHAEPLAAGMSFFRDTTAAPGRAYSYRVTGIAINGLRGVPSLPVRIGADDPLAAGPRMLMARRVKEGLRLEWAGRERHGKALHLYRSVDAAEPVLLRSLPPDAGSFTDTSPVKGALNLYVLRLVLPDGTEGAPSEAVPVRW